MVSVPIRSSANASKWLRPRDIRAMEIVHLSDARMLRRAGPVGRPARRRVEFTAP